MKDQTSPIDVLVKVPVTFNAIKNLATRKTGWKPPNVLNLPKMCIQLVKDTRDPLGILGEFIRKASAIFPDKSVTFYVCDHTTFSALRVLHKRRIIEMRLMFVCEAGTEQEVLVAQNGKLSSWPSSVLDLDSQFVDELIGD